MLSFILCLFSFAGFAQSGVSLGGSSNTPAKFDNFQKIQDGLTASNYIQLQYNIHDVKIPGWKLTVKATGPFTNGTNSVDVQYVSIQYNNTTGSDAPSDASIPMPTSPVQLSTSEQVIVAHSNVALQSPPTYYFAQFFDMSIQGGAQLFVSDGDYSTNLIFTLYNESGVPVSSVTIPVTFQIYYSGGHLGNNTLGIVNGGKTVNFSFDNPADYQNGISVSKPQSLHITGSANYSVIVQTAVPNAEFTYSGSSPYDLPIDIIHLQAAVSAVNSGCGGISTNTITLSTSAQTLLSNSDAGYPCEDMYYDLTWFTQPDDSRIKNAPSGSYTTQIAMILTPL